VPDTGDIFGNMMIGIMEGHEETSTFQWFTNLLQQFTNHFESLQAAAELYKTYATKPYKDLTFKVLCFYFVKVLVKELVDRLKLLSQPSTYKADPILGFIATNLHSQELQIFSPESILRISK